MIKDTRVSIFKTLKNTDVPYYLSLEKCLKRIKEGKSQERVEGIRKAKDKAESTKIKIGLPAIVIAGTFRERNKKGLEEHSGLMVVDFDKYPTKKALKDHLKELKKIKNFVSLFISPSGNGIKGFVHIPKCEAKDHERYFRAFYDEHKFEYFDPSNCDVCRVCFESYIKSLIFEGHF